MTPPRADNLHYLLWLIPAATLAALIYLLGPILTPFLLAAILAYICNPLVTRISKKIPRSLATVLVMALLIGAFTLLLLIMLPLVQKEAALIATRVPAYLEIVKDRFIPWLQTRLGIALQLDSALLKEALLTHWQSAGSLAAKGLQAWLPSLASGGMAFLGLLMNLLLVPVVLFYLLRDWNVLLARIAEMIPRRWHSKTQTLATETDAVLAEFLRGQLAVMLLMSVYYVAALWLAGLEFSLPIGLVAGLLVFVPYLGMITGLLLATLAALLQFPDWNGVLIVWAVFGLGQLLEGLVVTPWLVGERIGLHPVAVIFALLAFGQLFGFFGVLLALPVSAALLVWLRHLHEHYLQSALYK